VTVGLSAPTAGYTALIPQAEELLVKNVENFHRTPKNSLHGKVRSAPALGLRWHCAARCVAGWENAGQRSALV